MSNQLERILHIDRAIRSGARPTAKQLAAELEVCVRRIYDDRAYMIDRLSAPIAWDGERGGWYYTEPAYALPDVFLKEGELLAFLLTRELSQRYLGTAWEEPLRGAIARLAAYLPDRVRLDLDAASHQYSFLAGATSSADPDLLLALHRAVHDCRRLQITYYTASRDAERERLVDPYHLCNIRGDWYLIAHDHWRGRVLMFHAARIRAWTVTPDRFARDPRFSADAYLAESFLVERGDAVHDVAVRFDAEAARYVREKRWRPGQAIEDLPDGGLVLRFRASGLNEVRRWVMGYGSHAEALEPAALRQAVADEARRMAARYDA